MHHFKIFNIGFDNAGMKNSRGCLRLCEKSLQLCQCSGRVWRPWGIPANSHATVCHSMRGCGFVLRDLLVAPPCIPPCAEFRASSQYETAASLALRASLEHSRGQAELSLRVQGAPADPAGVRDPACA